VAHKNAQKLFKITDSIGATCAGVVGDIQGIIGLLTAEANLYEMKNGKKISTKALARLTSNILQGQRNYPLIAWIVLGGYDSNGAEAYSIDPVGGVNKDTMISTGSGSTVAYGILEDRFRENMTIEEGIELSIRAINAAIQRDLAEALLSVAKTTPLSHTRTTVVVPFFKFSSIFSPSKKIKNYILLKFSSGPSRSALRTA